MVYISSNMEIYFGVEYVEFLSAPSYHYIICFILSSITFFGNVSHTNKQTVYRKKSKHFLMKCFRELTLCQSVLDRQCLKALLKLFYRVPNCWKTLGSNQIAFYLLSLGRPGQQFKELFQYFSQITSSSVTLIETTLLTINPNEHHIPISASFNTKTKKKALIKMSFITILPSSVRIMRIYYS